MKRIKNTNANRRSRGADGSGESNYGRKRAYLYRNGGMGLDYFPLKPWKLSTA
jgi:hypothetical protein